MSAPTPILQYNLSDASVKGLLPSGYTPLAYIESSGTLYIDTGAYFKYNSIIHAELSVINNTGNYCFFGASNGTTYNTGDVSIWYSGTLFHYCYPTSNSAGNYYNLGNLSNNYDKLSVNITSSFCNVNSTRYDRSIPSDYVGTKTISLFCAHRSGYVNPSKSRIYIFTMYNPNGLLDVDLRPARRDSDGVIGMYDLVSRTFKTNAGSGAFIAGPELAVGKNGGKSLPEEYQLVEYLQMAPGLYINTGQAVAANDVTKTEAWMWYASGSTRDLMGWSSSAADYWGCTTNSTWEKATGVSPITQRQKVIYEHTASTAGTYQIGALTGGYSTRTKYIEQVKITIGGSLKRNLYACYRKSDMKPGMYDTVTGTFYTNLGSGEFILGPSITNCYTWEPNAGSGTLQGLYVDCNSIYDVNKGWCLSGNDSTYSYVEFPKEVINPLITAKTFTIAFWFRVHNTNRHILFGSSSNYPLNIEYYGTKMRYYFSGSPDKMGSTTIATNTWYHVALCVTSTGFTAYINGNVDATHTSAPAFNQFTGNCRIGSDSRDTSIYLGSDVLNFMIFNTALTSAQVKELYGK